MARIKACDACFKKKVRFGSPPLLSRRKGPGAAVAAESPNLTLAQIQCIIRQPNGTCNWCRHNGITCTFTRKGKGKEKLKLETPERMRQGGTDTVASVAVADNISNRFTHSDIQELFGRVAHLESALAAANAPIQQYASAQSHESPAIGTAAQGDSQRPHHHRHVPGHHHHSSERLPSLTQVFPSPVAPPPSNLASWQRIGSKSLLGQSWYCSGVAVFSDEGLHMIAAKAGDYVNFNSFPQILSSPEPTLRSDLSTFQSYTPFRQLCTMPPRLIAGSISSILFDPWSALVFPILDGVLFKDTLEMAYEDTGTVRSAPHLLAKACILATLSVATRFLEFGGSGSPVDADLCAAKARGLLQHVNGDESLTSLQTVLLLVSIPPDPSYSGQRNS